MEHAKILVVDDDREIGKALERLLTLEGFQVDTATNGLEALEILKRSEIQLILMDIMMPKMDGLSATLKIREQKNIPIIVLSAKSEDSDIVLGLSMGADDYVTKPFQPQELVARVRSQLRRYLHLGDAANNGITPVLRAGGLTLNQESKEFFVDGAPVKLTPKEFQIMEFLMRHPGMVFSADRIYESVWNEPAYSVENTVMVHIRRIREKVEINPKEPKYLKVVWGVGYKIEKHHS